MSSRRRPTKMQDLRKDNPFAQFLMNESKRPGAAGSDARLLVSAFQGRTIQGLRGEIERFVDDLDERGVWLDRLQRLLESFELRTLPRGDPDDALPGMSRPGWVALGNGAFKRAEHRGTDYNG